MRAPVIAPGGTVRPQAVATTRRIAPQAEVSGLSQAGQGVANALLAAAELEDRRLAELDEATVKDLVTEWATEVERPALWGDEQSPGALAQTGRDALVAIPDVQKRLAEKREEYLSRAQGKRQQEMAKRALDARMANANDQLSRWQMTQTRAYNVQQGVSRQAVLTEDAIRGVRDPKVFATSMIALEQQVRDNADLIGQDDPDTVKVAVMEARGNVYRGVVAELIDTDPAGARRFVELNKDRMPSATYQTLSAATEKADRTASVVAQADSLWASSGQDYGKAMALASANADPQTRLALENRINVLKNQADQVEADQKEATYKRLAPQISAGVSFDKLPANDRMEAARLGLETNLRSLESGRKRGPGSPEFVAIRARAGSDEFNALDLSSFEVKPGVRLADIVTAEEMGELYTLQAKRRDTIRDSVKPYTDRVMAGLTPQINVLFADRKPDERAALRAQAEAFVFREVTNRTRDGVFPQGDVDEIIKIALGGTGIDDTPYFFQTQAATLFVQEPAAFNRLRETLTAANGGKAAGYGQMQEALDRAAKGKAIVPFDQIPAQYRSALIDRFNAMPENKGKKPMQRDIEQLYNKFLIGEPI